MKTAVVLLILILFAGCGPRRLSPQELAARKAHAAQVKSQEAAKAKEKKAQEAKKAAAQARQDRLNRIANDNKKELALQPLPPGVHQIGSMVFLADRAHIAFLRHICRGTDSNGDGNDVDEAKILPDGSIQVNCKSRIWKYRDETWQNDYLRHLRTHTPMPGVPIP